MVRDGGTVRVCACVCARVLRMKKMRALEKEEKKVTLDLSTAQKLVFGILQRSARARQPTRPTHTSEHAVRREGENIEMSKKKKKKGPTAWLPGADKEKKNRQEWWGGGE